MIFNCVMWPALLLDAFRPLDISSLPPSLRSSPFVARAQSAPHETLSWRAIARAMLAAGCRDAIAWRASRRERARCQWLVLCTPHEATNEQLQPVRDARDGWKTHSSEGSGKGDVDSEGSDAYEVLYALARTRVTADGC